MKIHLDAEFDPVYNVDFSNFSKVTSVTLSKDVSMISMMFMRACSNVKEYMVASGNEDYYSKGGVLYLTDGTIECYPAASDRTSFTVPEGTPGLTQNSFVGCLSLQSLTLPASLKTANCGVSDCPNLKEITFLGTDTEILESFGRRCSSELTIYGYKNSTAERFAADYGFNFVDLNSKASPEPEPEPEPEPQPQPQPSQVTQPESRTEAPPPPTTQVSQPKTSVQSDPEESSKAEASTAPESKEENSTPESRAGSKTKEVSEAAGTEGSDDSDNKHVNTTPKNTGSGAAEDKLPPATAETTAASSADYHGIILCIWVAAAVLTAAAAVTVFILRKRGPR